MKQWRKTPESRDAMHSLYDTIAFDFVVSIAKIKLHNDPVRMQLEHGTYPKHKQCEPRLDTNGNLLRIQVMMQQLLMLGYDCRVYGSAKTLTNTKWAHIRSAVCRDGMRLDGRDKLDLRDSHRTMLASRHWHMELQSD